MNVEFEGDNPKKCGKCGKKIQADVKNRCRDCYLSGQKTRGAHRFWRTTKKYDYEVWKENQ